MFNRIQTPKRYTFIVDQVLDLLEQGQLTKGDKLPSEAALTEMFGVSRATVRQALSALEVLGVIEAMAGKGNYVKNRIDISALRYRSKALGREISPEELLETRKFLESDVAEVAARKSKPSDLHALDKCLNEFRAQIKSKEIDYSKLGQLDRNFHLLLAKATHNAALVQMMRFIIRSLRGQVWINLKSKSLATPGHLEKYLADHEAVLKALQSENGQNARNIMYQHIHSIEKDLFG
jgi:GntR family transcriptional regulator, transcriptional repressor for pyruvate dehydrogenase complex